MISDLRGGYRFSNFAFHFRSRRKSIGSCVFSKKLFPKIRIVRAKWDRRKHNKAATTQDGPPIEWITIASTSATGRTLPLVRPLELPDTVTNTRARIDKTARTSSAFLGLSQSSASTSLSISRSARVEQGKRHQPKVKRPPPAKEAGHRGSLRKAFRAGSEHLNNLPRGICVHAFSLFFPSS